MEPSRAAKFVRITTAILADSPAGDVTKVTLPDGSFLLYAYDDARRLAVIANQIGEKIEFAYDLARNVTQQVTKDSGGTTKRTQTRKVRVWAGRTSTVKADLR